MPRVVGVQPAAVEIYWKYRLESIQSIRLGTVLTKPNMDSDLILDGIQNEGLVDVNFIPSAERIDLYYRSLNEAGRGPSVDIIATTDEFLLNNSIQKRTSDLYMRGAGVLNLQAGDILRVEDEMVIVESHVLLNRTQLYEGIIAFWYLNEGGGDRSNVFTSDKLENFTQNPVLSQDGPQAGTDAAHFTGSITNPQALSAKFSERLSLGNTDNNNGFTFSCWARLHDNSVDRVIISRYGSVAGGRREFQLQYNSAQNRFEALLSKSSLGIETIYTMTHSGNVAENTWYFIICWFDTTANRLYLSVNNTPENIIIPTTGAIQYASIPTTIGAQLVEESNNSARLVVSNPWNGRIANVGFWKRVLTGAERISLFRDYTLDSVPAAHVILEDRGAHGTTAVAHNADVIITKMRPTVPHNSIVMDALADNDIPDAPESFLCVPSGDDAEIGVETVVSPPIGNRKTIKRIEIQAKTAPIFPSNIEFTTGSKLILSGPHGGEVTQGGNELITSFDLSGLAPPHHLYTYENIDVDTGIVVAAYAYTINTIEAIPGTSNWRIRINESFVASRGIFGNSRDVFFLVVRGWLDAPRDYVINDAPLVTPPAGDFHSHEPFQRFYKTTKNIYLRARYINRNGAGPWIYWDGVNGSTDKSSAVLFSPAGIQLPAIDLTPQRHSQAWTVNVQIRPVDHDTIRWSAGIVKFSDGTTQTVSTSGSPKTLSPDSNNGVWYVYKRFSSSILQFTQDFSIAIGTDRIDMGIAVTTATANGMATVLIKGDSGGPHISAQSIAVNVLSALSANLGEVLAGILTGLLIRTSASGQRLELSSNNILEAFNATENVGRLGIATDPMGVEPDYLFIQSIGTSRSLGISSESDVGIFTNTPVGGDQFQGVLRIFARFVNMSLNPGGNLNVTSGDIVNIGSLRLDAGQSLGGALIARDGKVTIYVDSANQLKAILPDGTIENLTGAGSGPTTLGAADVTLITTNFGNNIPTTVTNVQALADAVDNLVLGGTGGTDMLAGTAVTLDPTNFGNNLPVSIIDVQAFADAVDDLVLGMGSGGPPFTADVDFGGFDALNIGEAEIDSLAKDGPGSIQITDDVEISTGKNILFAGIPSDIGTESNQFANAWGNACILNSLALRDNQDFTAQAGRTIIYVEGAGSNRQVKIRYPDGTTDDLPGEAGELPEPVTSLAGSAVTLDPTNFGGNLPVTIVNVQAFAEAVDDLTLETDDQTAAEVSLDPSSFGGNLPVTIEDVQALADAVDNLTLGTSVQLPPVVYLSASTESTTPGGAVTLRWNTDQTSVLTFNQGIGGVTSVASGSMVVNPLVTTHYRAIASGAGGAPDTSSVVVVVAGTAPDLPVIDSFTIDDLSVAPGGSTNLRWATTDATEVEIIADINGEAPVGDLDLDGSVEVTPGEAVTFTLRARNAANVVVEATVSVSITYPRTTTARRLFVADSTSDRLFEVDPDGSTSQGTSRTMPSGLTQPGGMVNYGESLLVSDDSGDELWDLDQDGGNGQGIKLRDFPSEISSPLAIVVYKNRVLVMSGKRIYEVHPHGENSQVNLLRVADPVPPVLAQGAAVYEGRLIIVSQDDRLIELDPDGTDDQGVMLRSLPADIAFPVSATVHDGRFFVSNNFPDALWEVDPDGADDEGTELREFPALLNAPIGMASIPPINSDADPVVGTFSYTRNGTSVTFSWETLFADEVRLQIASSDDPGAYIDFVTGLDPGGTQVQTIDQSSGLYWRIKAINNTGPTTYSDGLIPS